MTDTVIIQFNSRELLQLADTLENNHKPAALKIRRIADRLRLDLIADDEVLDATGSKIYHDLEHGQGREI